MCNTFYILVDPNVWLTLLCIHCTALYWVDTGHFYNPSLTQCLVYLVQHQKQENIINHNSKTNLWLLNIKWLEIKVHIFHFFILINSIFQTLRPSKIVYLLPKKLKVWIFDLKVGPRTTNAQWSLFWLKSRTDKLGRLWGIWDIFDQTISTPFVYNESRVHVFHYSTIISTKN